MTKILVLAAVVLFVVFAGVAILKVFLQNAHAKESAYYLRKSLFTPAELAFLAVLERSLPAGLRVFGKVRLEDIFGVKKHQEPSAYQSARNRINRRHVDFLLVDSGSLAPLAGIELDDSSHEEEDRRQRDVMVDDIFKGTGLPLLRFPVRKSYDSSEVRAKISAALSAS